MFGLDTLLAVYAAVFLAFYASDAVLVFTNSWGLISKPVELFILLLLPIVLRVHFPDWRRNNLTRTLSMWGDNNNVLVPFFCIVLLSFLASLLPGSGLAADGGRSLYILVYRFIMFAGALSAAILLFRFGWRYAIILTLCVALGSIFYEVVNPAFFSDSPARAAGFLSNPNQAAITIV
ncbi:MAG: hypothetical protein AAFY56_22285, partial [Pseudomonadota bacterium]